MEIINATDGYKLGHHRMYPEGTQMVYSNWTPRSCRYFPEATEGSVVFGIQYFVKKYLIEEFNKWFALPKEEAIKQFAYRVGNFVDLNQVGTKHIEELYDLGYLPIEIKALPDFFWLTNYLETLISCTLWLPCTSATSARLYKKRLMDFNRPFTLKVITKMLGNSNAENISVLEPHSDAIYDYRFGDKFRALYPEKHTRPDGWTVDYQLVLPDAGAVKRYEYLDKDPISCSKVRDTATGKILEIKIDNPEKLDSRPLMIIDDLCDGGGTFCGIAECFKKIGIPKDRLNISVVHMVNPNGIENLSKNFNHVWFTNSYKDWENLPENVTMIKVV